MSISKTKIRKRISGKPTVKKIVTETISEPEKPIAEIPAEINENIKPVEVTFDISKKDVVPYVPVEPATLNSQSMLDDLMTETDKDSESESYEDDPDYEEAETGTEKPTPGNDSTSSEKTIGDKITDTINSEGEDWENPADWRKICSVNAMMYVEGGAIALSFLGQLISGDWSREGETKYMPSEERRKLIRNPLAKKMEMNKNRKKSSPTGAMITAIIFTIIPIIIIAFKDRKAKIDKELKEIEAIKLREELEKSNAVIAQLKSQISSIQPQVNPTTYKAPTGFNRVEKRGRHKKDCDCDKCNLSRMKTKEKESRKKSKV